MSKKANVKPRTCRLITGGHLRNIVRILSISRPSNLIVRCLNRRAPKNSKSEVWDEAPRARIYVESRLPDESNVVAFGAE